MFFYITASILARTIILYPIVVPLWFLFTLVSLLFHPFMSRGWADYKRRCKQSFVMLVNIALLK